MRAAGLPGLQSAVHSSEVEITIDDPKAYTKSWTVTETPHLIADTELLEFVCLENERDQKHMVGK